MKKNILILLLVICILCVGGYAIYKNAISKTEKLQGTDELINEETALKLGEEAYYKFLIFTHDSNDYTINGKVMNINSQNSLVIETISVNDTVPENYIKVNNFEEYFKSLFVAKISYDDIFKSEYGIGYILLDSKYYIDRGGRCSSNYQKDILIKVAKIEKQKIYFTVSSKIVASTPGAENFSLETNEYTNELILNLENKNYKISKVTLIETCSPWGAYPIDEND